VSSLIGVSGVKLFLVPSAIPAGYSLLFAVGARPPQDGVRRARRPNLSCDLRCIAALRLWTLSEITSPIVPTGTTLAPPSSGGNWNSSPTGDYPRSQLLSAKRDLLIEACARVLIHDGALFCRLRAVLIG
jgi:hypothetical protein